MDRRWCRWSLTLGVGLAAGGCGGPSVPDAARAGSPFASISAGANTTCALTQAGVLYCWGRTLFTGASSSPDDCGSRGNDVGCSKTPAPLAGAPVFEQVEVGGSHACGIAAGGAASCWGDNVDGQLGSEVGLRGTGSPAPVAGGLLFRSVAPGSFHTCGLTTGAVAYCWGRNIEGQLGNGRGGGYTGDTTVPVAVAGGGGFQSVSAGYDFACGIDRDGRASCWGLGLYGSRSQTKCNPAGDCNLVPEPVPGDLRFKTVVAGTFHACALTESGAAYCWGSNREGALGDGTTVTAIGLQRPSAVVGGFVFRAITAGDTFTCGLTPDGVAYCWGTGRWGVLGNGSETPSSVPLPVTGGHRFQSLSAGMEYACGVTTEGTAYCWGRNDNGQLGDGSVTYRTVPTLVAGQRP